MWIHIHKFTSSFFCAVFISVHTGNLVHLFTERKHIKKAIKDLKSKLNVKAVSYFYILLTTKPFELSHCLIKNEVFQAKKKNFFS